MRNITIFAPVLSEQAKHNFKTIDQFFDNSNVIPVFHPENIFWGRPHIVTKNLRSTNFLTACYNNSSSPYILIFIQDNLPIPTQHAKKITYTISETKPSLIYGNYLDAEGQLNKLIPFQKGSVREDFDFGSFILFPTELLDRYLKENTNHYEIAGLYHFLLFLSRKISFQYINEPFFQQNDFEIADHAKKMFDYVNPKNKKSQKEYEEAFTDHLTEIGATVKNIKEVKQFKVFNIEASIIIPVKNREKTIADAINSCLKQKTSFLYNIIIVDNFSTDQTSAIIKSYADKNKNIIHLKPLSQGLGIGGCWNEAIHHPSCGKFAVQLDSDDLYFDKNTLQTIVDKFYETKAAMVIGTYQMVNFKLEPIPPGIVDHKEWTEDNGANNALRVNGFGAPRAFYTPILRSNPFPDVSYGEDYAVCLAISRIYKVGRIYNPLYLCRRWDDNTDSNIDRDQINKNNFFKDQLRTDEISIRQKMK